MNGALLYVGFSEQQLLILDVLQDQDGAWTPLRDVVSVLSVTSPSPSRYISVIRSMHSLERYGMVEGKICAGRDGHREKQVRLIERKDGISEEPLAMTTPSLDYYHHVCACGFDGYMLRAEQAVFVAGRCPGCGVEVLWQWAGIPMPPISMTVDDVRRAFRDAGVVIDDDVMKLLGLTPEGESK